MSTHASSSRPPLSESASTRPPIFPSVSSPLYSRKAKGNEPVNLDSSMGLCAPIDVVVVPGDSAPLRSRRSMARDPPSRPRSLSKRRYQLPQEVQEKGDYCCCCEGETRDELRVFGVEPSTSEATAWAKGLEVAGQRRGPAPQADDRDDTLVSSVDSVSPVPSLSRSARPPLFDDDSDSSTDDESACGSLPSSSFSPFTPTSFTPITPATSLSRSPSLRKSSVPTTATSDPLLSPSPSSTAPILSFGTSSRGHWLPARPGKLPTASGCTTDPLLPDIPVGPSPPSPPETPTPSTARRTPTSSPPKDSLLTKSLRSLARLPNLTLPNLLPRLPPPDSYLAGSPEPSLKAGWGAAERRRVLDAEPSYEADEARGLLLRRRGSSGTGGWIGGRRAGGPLTVVDDDAGAAVLADSAAAAAAGTAGGELAMEDFSANAAAAAAMLPAPPSPSPSPTPPPPSSSPPSTTMTESDSFLAAPSRPSPPSPSPPPPPPSSPPLHTQRFISNHRHLLMLSIEFSMMRADKIRSPLRPRAVIVRQASPSRTGAGHSALRREVLP
ncbi:hypothetical protein JCM5296_004665 [Sporobolomyces johnsonii]